jgi:hypothetical protein
VTQVTLTQPLVSTSLLHMGQVIFLLHYSHICTHQVIYLVIPSVRWPTVKSFTQPQLHKLLNLHLQLYKWGVLLYPSLEVNLQWEANLFSWGETFWGETLNYGENSYVGLQHQQTWGKATLQVLPSLLPLACILDNHIQELQILYGVNLIRWAFLSKELFPINL